MSECSTFNDGHSALSGIRLRVNIGIDILLSKKKGPFSKTKSNPLYLAQNTEKLYL